MNGLLLRHHSCNKGCVEHSLLTRAKIGVGECGLAGRGGFISGSWLRHKWFCHGRHIGFEVHSWKLSWDIRKSGDFRLHGIVINQRFEFIFLVPIESYIVSVSKGKPTVLLISPSPSFQFADDTIRHREFVKALAFNDLSGFEV